MSIQMITTTTVSSSMMPPPCKVMRKGSHELQAAIQSGNVELSLPQQEWSSWVSSAHHDEWHNSNVCETGESTNSGSFYVENGELLSHETLEEDPSPPMLQPASQQSKGQSSSIKRSRPTQDDEGENSDPLIDTSLPRFSDIIGHSAVKLRLDEVLLPLALPPTLADSILVGVRSLSASILLFGPPGCGKTQLARAIAGEAEAAFLSASPSDILSKFVGESEAAIRSLFDKAHEQAQKVESKCAILFFDEIDALGQSRGGPSHGDQGSPSDPSSRRVLAELLIQLNRLNITRGRGGGTPNSNMSSTSCITDESWDDRDDISSCSISSDEPNKSHPRIVVVAATNRPEDCDPALLRRFAVRVMVDLPTNRDRKKILKRFLIGIQHSISKEQLDQLSMTTEGWTGSDLESLTREAAMAPVRECIHVAAVMKRRNARKESSLKMNRKQSCGTSTRQKLHSLSPEREILEQFSNLRPVSVHDFINAIAFWAYNHRTGDILQNDEYKSEEEKSSFNGDDIHYDSSSDEDDA